MLLRKKYKIFITYVALIAVSILGIFPIYWMVILSIRRYDMPHMPTIEFIPSSFTLKHYKYVFANALFWRYFANSIIVSIGVIFIAVIISAFSGYALSRFKFLGKQLFSLSLLFSQSLPPILLAIPLARILGSLKLVNTYPGLIIAHMTFALPFCVWMLRGYFKNIPRELEEAAMIDGCQRFQLLWRIVLPLALPGIVAVALFAFILSWQDYLFGLILMTSEEMKTLTVGGASFYGVRELNWGNMMAFTTLAALPALIFFLFLQKFLVQGLTAGAIKG